MPQTKIVLIGAASANFGVDTLAALFADGSQLHGSTVILVDVDEQALRTVTELGRRGNDEYGASLTIESTTDRRAALADAEFVVVSVERDRYPAWERDWKLIREHGAPPGYCENGGPGGLLHGMRIIPLVVDICRDVARIAPKALVLNYSNPMSRVCLAATRHTEARVVGLCHQIGNAYNEVGRVLGWITAPEGSDAERSEAAKVRERLGMRACGLNHLTFITRLWDRETHSDLYSLFRERLAGQAASFAPLARRLNDIFGLYPTGGDLHVSEYFGWGSELCEVEPTFTAWEARGDQRKRLLDAALRAEVPLKQLFARTNELERDRAVDVITAILSGSDQPELAVNVVNNGCIPGLPQWAIVEVPAVVGAEGIHPLRMPRLPDGVTAMLNQQIIVQDRAVEAAVHGDRTAGLQALLLDSFSGAMLTKNEQLLESLGDSHRRYLRPSPK